MIRDSNMTPPDDELTKYVLDHYGHLCTDTEQLALRVLNLQLKAEHAQSPVIKSKLAEFCETEHNPQVQEIVLSGRNAARREIRDRLLNDHREAIFLNYCPRCSALCRTPLAQMCVGCGHSW